MENQRKRQIDDLEADTAPSTDPKKLVKIEEKLEEIASKALDLDEEFPILTSMIAAPKIGSFSRISESKMAEKKAPAPGYPVVYNSFIQFLNGYLAAGGDQQLANTLAHYAASLPVPTPHHAQIPVPPTPKPIKTEPATNQNQMTPDDEENPSNSEKVIIQNDKSQEEPKEIPESVDSDIADSLSSALVPSESKNAIVAALQPAKTPEAAGKVVSDEIERLREAAFGRYRNVLCVICNEWICSRNRKNHIEAHLNYRPYKCSLCDYARRREIFVIQHIKTHHPGQTDVKMLTNVDLNIALEVDRLADECVERTRKLIDSMQEKKDGDFGEGLQFDEKALELMLAEEQEKKVVVIESVSEVRVKVANYHRRQRTKVLKKIYDTDVAKQAELKIVKDEEGAASSSGLRLDDAFEINLEDLMQMIQKQEEEQNGRGGGGGGAVEETV